MAGSTLDPDNIPARKRRHTQKGHDVASLGPSDTASCRQQQRDPESYRERSPMLTNPS